MKRYCLACDLKDEESLIEEYKKYHAVGSTRPAITRSIKDAGVLDMEIYLIGNRLFMIMEVGDSFSFEKKARMDAENEDVQEWEELMWDFQQALPWAKNGEKWIRMEKIFKLDN